MVDVEVTDMVWLLVMTSGMEVVIVVTKYSVSQGKSIKTFTQLRQIQCLTRLTCNILCQVGGAYQTLCALIEVDIEVSVRVKV